MLLERGVFFWVNRIRCEYALKTFGLGDYFGTITVFHELHCLVRIKSHPFPPQKINTWRRVCERQKKVVPPPDLNQEASLNPQPSPSISRNKSTKAFSEKSLSAQSENLKHDSHSIKFLRQGVMCRGDISPIAMPRDASQPDMLGKSSSRQECASWEGILLVGKG